LFNPWRTSEYRRFRGRETLDSGLVLDVQALTCSFGGVRAVDNVSFRVTRGECVGIIGPNGAGKTTLLNSVSGVNRDYQGRVFLLGMDVSGWPLHRRARLGMARSFQTPRMFERMTVLSNLMVAPRGQSGENPILAFLGRWRGVDRRNLVLAHSLLAHFGLDRVANNYASELSGGQERLVELARALMGEPQLLLLDEPFAGVSPANRSRLIRRIRELSVKDGVTVVLVEHRLEWLAQLCDRVIVMAEGRVIAEGPLATVTSDRAVIDAYLGRQAG
jgi:branched-chain amino acid transport system ATP-binding protein